MRNDRAKILRRLPHQAGGNTAFKIEKVGVSEFDLSDPYHLALTLTWPQFFVGLLVVYLAINMVFALLFFAGRVFLQHRDPGHRGLRQYGAGDHVQPRGLGRGNFCRHATHRHHDRAGVCALFQAARQNHFCR